jgi:hypothetical protein
MAVFIREVISEVIIEPATEPGEPGRGRDTTPALDLDTVVRRAAERVLELLRREWDR